MKKRFLGMPARRHFSVLRVHGAGEGRKTYYLLSSAGCGAGSKTKKAPLFYVLVLRRGEPPVRVFLGTSCDLAMAHTHLLARHAVSPCHVPFVVADLAAEI